MNRSSAQGRRLTQHEVVVQSALIHPDWDVQMHRWYLENEEFHSPETVSDVDIERWLEELRHS